MEEWKPRGDRAFDADAMLTAEEHRVYAALDGDTSVEALAARLGIPIAHVSAILARLLRHGALLRERTETHHEPIDQAVEAEESSGAIDDDDDENQARSNNYRKIYETELHPLPRDARIAAAVTVAGPHLLALCFDADPNVVRAILENGATGLDHARLIATHHKNPAGLEAVVARAEFARDAQVARRLFRNDQLSELLLKRLLVSRRMPALFGLARDRDVPERSRSFSRGYLRQRFASAGSDERAEVIVRTEGRVLALLVGQTFDARTTSLLCARASVSIALIQNLARFPACPPTLLAHLVKLPMVRRQPALKKALMQHPNMPGDIKRSLA
jgi:hypothetical protein